MRSTTGLKLLLLVCLGICAVAFLLFYSADLPSEVKEEKKTFARKVPAKHAQPNEANAAELKDDSVARKRLPDAIVVGAGKCGTDAIITYLNMSDSFVINILFDKGMREVNYFNSHYDNGHQWYIDQMPAAKDSQVLVEKCAPYFWNPVVPARVYNLKPDMKLVMVLCDPVKRLVSLYSHINSYKLADGSDPLPSLTDLIQLKDGKLTENPHPRIVLPLLETGLYSKFVNQWLEYFPLSQMVFVSGEGLIEDPLTEVDKVTKFLGKPNAVTSDNIYYDKDRGFYCFKGQDGSRWCMDRSTKGRAHPSLAPELLKSLQDHFQSSNAELESTIGSHFGWPKYFGKPSK